MADLELQTVEALESTCDVEVVVFDKTGTLTLGKLAIESATYYPHQGWSQSSGERDIQELVRALTASSTHPVSAAVHEHVIAALGGLGMDVCAQIEVGDVRVVPGKGVEAAIGGVVVRGGSAAWAGGEDGGESTEFVVSVAVDDVSRFLMSVDLVLTVRCRPNLVSNALRIILYPTPFGQTRWRLFKCLLSGVSRCIF